MQLLITLILFCFIVVKPAFLEVFTQLDVTYPWSLLFWVNRRHICGVLALSSPQFVSLAFWFPLSNDQSLPSSSEVFLIYLLFTYLSTYFAFVYFQNSCHCLGSNFLTWYQRKSSRVSLIQTFIKTNLLCSHRQCCLVLFGYRLRIPSDLMSGMCKCNFKV